MKLLGTAVLILALAANASAQRRGGGGMGGPRVAAGHPGVSIGVAPHPIIPFRNYGSPTGFGNVVFPGTGTAPPIVDPFAFSAPFAQRLGASISGYAGRTVPRSRFGRGPLVFPVAYPVYVESPYAAEPPPPNITIVMPPQQTVPPVTINQNFVPETARPSVREYGPGASNNYPPARETAAPVEEEPDLFLIALKDSTVYTAVRYWVEGDALHYVTPRGRQNKVSLDLVDRALSERLNRGRETEFRLPAR